MTRALAAARLALVAIAVAAGPATACGGGDEPGREAGGGATETTTETDGNGGAITNGTDGTTESIPPDDTTTATNGDDNVTDDGGCPEDGSGDCSFIIVCPEGRYEYVIGGTGATSATIVDAPSVAAVPDAPTRSVDDVVDVTLAVEDEQVRLTTLCADGITPAQATQPLEATGG